MIDYPNVIVPTAEQLAILEFARTRPENLMLKALAGTAKTTTIEMIAKALTRQPILYIVFNKKNQLEAEKRMPGHVRCMTANSVGHRAWAQKIGRQPAIDTKKNYNILKSLVDSLNTTERKIAYESFSEILNSIRVAKQSGYTPPDANYRGLCTDDPFEYNPSRLELYLLHESLKASIKAGFSGTIDFDDQIYLPVIFGAPWPEFPLVVLDEAQDLSAINHAMIAQLAKGRLIAAGDNFQSIYAFRGSVSNGMSKLQTTYNMEVLPLSTCFRCSQSVIRNAHWRAPTMTWPDETPEGTVNNLETLDVHNITDNSVILCRNNAPLFTTAMEILRAGRRVNVLGRDIGPGLVRQLKKLGHETMPQTKVFDAIDTYQNDPKFRVKASHIDRCDCLRVFAGQGATLGAAVAYAEHIFKSENGIMLSSGHRAKGLEWETVYHLHPHLIPSRWAEGEEEMEQELNIKYVIETRPRHTLNFVHRLKE